ncbi:Phospholipase D-like domain protein [Deinococcus phoenicis]|uniref:Phospholipase D-like domain protein n=1 Tax=Deinococcus phoenicis TaxID=1476583 RepID=A0A016QQH1_9DEIO|nr:phospholipase D-like domain-containing protein [Deinococcus phoenicis]EYB68333.1 Phospholipase D-like domain protein [Deinococcus phoenicis]
MRAVPSTRLTAWVLTLLALLAGPWPDARARGPLLAAGTEVVSGHLPPPDLAALDGLGLNTCPPPEAPLDRLLYGRTLDEGAALSCGNRVEGLLHFPNADPAYSTQPHTPQGGFDVLDTQLRETRRELLIANMIWDDGPDAPGAQVARAIAALRRDVADHPERHPQGLTVRVMLGNSIRLGALLDPTASAYSAARHLLAAGVPLTGDTVPGWRLEIANYAYVLPHHHVKLVVQDGETVLAGGFNISLFHVPADAPGGHGLDLTDLAIRVRGPVARHAVAAFHDGWALSHRLTCRATPAPETLRRVCTFTQPTAPLPLDWSAPAPAAGTAHVYPLYRRSGYTGADDTVTALFGAAQTSIDVMQSQVSGTLGCLGALFGEAGCPPALQLPVWEAAAWAIRERGVTLRLLLDYDPVLQAETLAFLRGLRAELAPLGLADHVQARWYGTAGGLHTKAALIDGQMLMVGSQNLHHSSFGRLGLGEYSLATSDPGAAEEYRRMFAFEWARAGAIQAPWWLPDGTGSAPPRPEAQPGDRLDRSDP